MANDDYTPDFQTPGQIAANRAYAKALMEAGTGIGQSGIVNSGGIAYASKYGPLLQGLQGYYGRQQMDKAGTDEQRSMMAPNIATARGPIPGEPGPHYNINPPGSPGTPSTHVTAYNDEPGQTKGSWFGNFQGNHKWVDKSDSGLQASGLPTSVPGIALPNRSTLGQTFDVTTPDGRTFTLKQTDLGPAKWTGRGVDVNSAAAEQMGYTPQNFPTDGKFTVRPHQEGAQASGTMGTGGPALQFAGPGAAGGEDAQSGITTALAAGRGAPAGPAGPSMGMPSKVPGDEGMQVAGGDIPGNFFPQRQQISREQFVSVMSNPYADPALKQYVANSYFSQFQPLSMQGPYGWTIVQDAQGRHIAVPPAPHWTEDKTGSISTQTPQVPTLGGGLQTLGGGGGPVTAPPQGGGSNIPPAGGGFNIGGGKNDIRPAPVGPRSEAAPAGKPVKTASLETGTATDAGPLAYAPPTAAPALANKPPGVQVAQAGNQPLNSMNLQDRIKLDQEMQLGLEQGKADVGQYNKEFQEHQDAAQTSLKSIPALSLLQGLFKDPNLIQGPWSSVKQAANDAFAALGNQSALAASSLKAAVDKGVATQILGQMQAQLRGLGQVRVAEINLLSQASASTYNTKEANAAILFLAQRSAQQLADIGKVTSAYRSGMRWDADGNVTTTNASDRPTSAGQNEAINMYLRNHPLVNADEIKDLQKTLDAGQPKQRTGPTKDQAAAELKRRQEKATQPAQ